MKGLLLKDLYMVRYYCKSYLVIAIAFIAFSFVGNDNLFLVFYPVLLCGMIPVNLLGYDERSRWLQYSGTLPYTKTQIVISKYLTGLFMQLAMLIIIGIARFIKLRMNGELQVKEFLIFMVMTLVISAISPAITLPFIFKMGVEKGRLAYYIMFGFAFACVFTLGTVVDTAVGRLNIVSTTVIAIICLIGIVIYLLSIYLSTVFYKKREIQ